MKNKTVSKAFDIAVNDLRACYGIFGIYAGLNHFNDYWTRDACFASFGALNVGDRDIVKRQIIHFINHRKFNWHLPKVILRSQFQKILFLTTTKSIRFRALSLLSIYHAKDQNSLFIIAASDYIKKCKDIEFAKEYIGYFEKIIQHDVSHDMDKNSLLEQSYYSDWEDSLRKTGEVLYTNICRCKALQSMAEIFNLLKNKEKHEEFSGYYKKTKAEINKRFWNGQYFNDTSKGDITFSGSGNALAMIWNIATKQQAKSIAKFVDEKNLFDFTLTTNYPRYSSLRVSPFLRLAGMTDYHNGMRWLWVGCAYAAGLWKHGMEKKSIDCMEKIAKKIIEYAHIYEVYEKDGTPVSRYLYKSEVPFAWSSGMFVYAVKEIWPG